MASSSVGEVAIELVASEQRIYGSEELGLLWRDATGPIPEAVAVDFSLNIMSAPAPTSTACGRRPRSSSNGSGSTPASTR